MTNLGVLPGATDSRAHALNNRGQVVGESSGRAFLWQDGEMIDLNDLSISSGSRTCPSTLLISAAARRTPFMRTKAPNKLASRTTLRAL